MDKRIDYILLFMLLFSACSNTNELVTVEPNADISLNKKTMKVTEEVTFAIQQATKNADFRLLHSKGRRIVVPGLEQLALTLIKSQCGLKSMPMSGDVLKTVEQRQQQKTQYAFAKQYNQAVYALCLESK